jgi:hypothetical protein
MAKRPIIQWAIQGVLGGLGYWITAASVTGGLLAWASGGGNMAEILKAVAPIATAGIAIQALRQNMQINRLKATFKIIDSFNRKEFLGSIDAFKKGLETGTELPETEVLGILGIYSDVALGIKHKYLEEDVIWESIGPTMTERWDSLRGHVSSGRLASIAGKKADYIEIEELMKKWGGLTERETEGTNTNKVSRMAWIGGFITMAVAFFALWVQSEATRATKKYQKASLKPIIEVVEKTEGKGHERSIWITNKGVGPAIIKAATTEMGNDLPKGTIARKENQKSGTLGVGEERRLVWIKARNPREAEEIASKVGVTVDYESLLGEHQVTEYPPKKVLETTEPKD